jgi:hypothetical protein
MSNLQSDATSEANVASASDAKPALEALHKFIDAFNRVDKNEIVSTLHFPHAVHSDGNDPIVYLNGEEFWDFLGPQFSNMKELEGWAYSTLDLTEIVNATPNTVHVLIEFSRRNAAGDAYGVARGVWVVTKKDERWALQVRSSVPMSGKINALAGQKITGS